MKLTKSQKLAVLAELRELLGSFPTPPKATRERFDQINRNVQKMFETDAKKIHLEIDEPHLLDGILTVMEGIVECEEVPEQATKTTIVVPDDPRLH